MENECLELTQILNGKIDNSLINPRLSGIYFLIKNNQIVYVGQSINTFGRILNHISQKRKDFDSFYVLDAHKENLCKLEAMYILKYEPLYNYSKKMKRFVVPRVEGDITQAATIKIPSADVSDFEKIKEESGLEKCSDIMLYLIRSHAKNNIIKNKGE